MAIKSFGATISVDATAVGGVTGITRSGADRNMIDVTTLTSTGGYREFIPGLKDGGTVEIEGNFLIADPGQIKLRAGDDDEVPVVITLSDGTTIGFDAFIIPPNEDNPLDDKVGFSASLKITGPLTYTPPTP